MREIPRDPERLQHILKAIANLELLTGCKTKEACENEIASYYAIIKNVEIIGEAAYMLTKEFRKAHSLTPWSLIERMRHILVHDYFVVNFEIVWNTIKEDYPLLKQQITQYLKEM